MNFPDYRARRMRRTDALRRMVRETRLSVDNLCYPMFVVGGSAFPQNAAQGPTATIGMLACWAADGIKEQYLKRPGPLV